MPETPNFTRPSTLKVLSRGVIAALRGYTNAKVKLYQVRSAEEAQAAKTVLEAKRIELRETRNELFERQVEVQEKTAQTEDEKRRAQGVLYDELIKQGKSSEIAGAIAGLKIPTSTKPDQSDFVTDSQYWQSEYDKLNKGRKEGEPEIFPDGMGKIDFLIQRGHLTKPALTEAEEQEQLLDNAEKKVLEDMGLHLDTKLSDLNEAQSAEYEERLAKEVANRIEYQPSPEPETAGDKILSADKALKKLYTDGQADGSVDKDEPYVDFLIARGKAVVVPKSLQELIKEAEDAVPALIKKGLTDFQAFAYALNPSGGIPPKNEEEIREGVTKALVEQGIDPRLAILVANRQASAYKYLENVEAQEFKLPSADMIPNQFMNDIPENKDITSDEALKRYNHSLSFAVGSVIRKFIKGNPDNYINWVNNFSKSIQHIVDNNAIPTDEKMHYIADMLMVASFDASGSAEERKAYRKDRENAKHALNIESVLLDLESKGLKTGLRKDVVLTFLRNVGLSPKIADDITPDHLTLEFLSELALHAYTQKISGAQFSYQEFKRYQQEWTSTGKSFQENLILIRGHLGIINRSNRAAMESRLGPILSASIPDFYKIGQYDEDKEPAVTPSYWLLDPTIASKYVEEEDEDVNGTTTTGVVRWTEADRNTALDSVLAKVGNKTPEQKMETLQTIEDGLQKREDIHPDDIAEFMEELGERLGIDQSGVSPDVGQEEEGEAQTGEVDTSDPGVAEQAQGIVNEFRRQTKSRTTDSGGIRRTEREPVRWAQADRNTTLDSILAKVENETPEQKMETLRNVGVLLQKQNLDPDDMADFLEELGKRLGLLPSGLSPELRDAIDPTQIRGKMNPQ